MSKALPEILLAVDLGDLSAWVLLDLSVAFNTEDQLPQSPLRVSTDKTKYPPVHFRIRFSVACDVSCSDTKHNHRRYSAVPVQATSVGNELCCSAGVSIVAVAAV